MWARPCWNWLDGLDWTYHDPSGLGFGIESPESLFISGPDGGTGMNGSFFTAQAPVDGRFTAHLHWSNTDQ